MPWLSSGCIRQQLSGLCGTLTRKRLQADGRDRRLHPLRWPMGRCHRAVRLGSFRRDARAALRVSRNRADVCRLYWLNSTCVVTSGSVLDTFPYRCRSRGFHSHRYGDGIGVLRNQSTRPLHWPDCRSLAGRSNARIGSFAAHFAESELAMVICSWCFTGNCLMEYEEKNSGVTTLAAYSEPLDGGGSKPTTARCDRADFGGRIRRITRHSDRLE